MCTVRWSAHENSNRISSGMACVYIPFRFDCTVENVLRMKFTSFCCCLLLTSVSLWPTHGGASSCAAITSHNKITLIHYGLLPSLSRAKGSPRTSSTCQWNWSKRIHEPAAAAASGQQQHQQTQPNPTQRRVSTARLSTREKPVLSVVFSIVVFPSTHELAASLRRRIVSIFAKNQFFTRLYVACIDNSVQFFSISFGVFRLCFYSSVVCTFFLFVVIFVLTGFDFSTFFPFFEFFRFIFLFHFCFLVLFRLLVFLVRVWV